MNFKKVVSVIVGVALGYCVYNIIKELISPIPEDTEEYEDFDDFFDEELDGEI